jgi:multiple sugar transport system substrate-binding protein
MGLIALAGCGGGSSGGRKTINLWVFNEPSGSFTDAAKRCSDASGGKYKIVYN